MYTSQIQERGHVMFPPFAGERHYMVPFFPQLGLPRRLSHWQPTVDAMLAGFKPDRPVFFMADQREVPAGESHRRPGVHVDGYWVPGLKAHGGGHRVGGSHIPAGRHLGRHGMSAAGKWSNNPTWSHVDFSEPELLLLASSVIGARSYLGDYDEAAIGDGGAYAGLVDELEPMDLMDHRVYAGTVGTLHESIPLMRGGQRTCVRLNCPGVTLQ